MLLFAALGRSYIYSKKASDTKKEEFRNALRKELIEIAKAYEDQVNEVDHNATIENLSANLSLRFADMLSGERFRIGIAQKALNLYLKYLWCIDLIPEPPHCPFDAVILRQLDGCSKLNWTTLDSIDDYKKLVEAARRKANDKSLADWELKLWINSIRTEQIHTSDRLPLQQSILSPEIRRSVPMPRREERHAVVSEHREIIFRPYNAWEDDMPHHDMPITLHFEEHWVKCTLGDKSKQFYTKKPHATDCGNLSWQTFFREININNRQKFKVAVLDGYHYRLIPM